MLPPGVGDRSSLDDRSTKDEDKDEDSEELDSDVLMLPPGVGDRDILMEGTDPLPSEWTHLNGEKRSFKKISGLP